MKYIISIFIIFSSLSSCLVDPVDIETDVECTPDSFVGEWEYQSTDGVTLDSIPDIIIELSGDNKSGDLLIDGVYYDMKSVTGCTAGDVSGFLDLYYELRSSDELLKKSSVLIFFGSTSTYKRK